MTSKDVNNWLLVRSPDEVDAVNAMFYGKYPYPWRPVKFDYLIDPHLETILLNQSLGNWQNSLVPKRPSILVAGCGTNQAVFTALRFPDASIVGVDISVGSLEVCEQSARALNIQNLELRRQSLNHITDEEAFDYIICTGVIHHNANPEATLAKLASALKPGGIMELMVYNTYHRIINTAFQKAVRILGQTTETAVNFEAELSLVRKLRHQIPVENLMTQFLEQFEDVPNSLLADALIQPVEHSYTVHSLNELVTACGLELLYPAIARSYHISSWHIPFQDAELQHTYDSLPDLDRWQVTNLLLLEKSPLLWFYLQKQDSGRRRQSEQQLCQAFLDTTFTKINTLQRSYTLNGQDKYQLSLTAEPFPAGLPHNSVKPLYEAVDGTKSMRRVFQELGIEPAFHTVNEARMRLTTVGFPYLQAVPAVEAPPSSGHTDSHHAGPSNKQKEKMMTSSQTSSRKKRSKSLKAFKPQTVALPTKELVVETPLYPESATPLLIKPATAEVDLAHWLKSNQEAVTAKLLKHGAILFRGFGIDAVTAFEPVALTLVSELFRDNGEHVPVTANNNVQTPVFYPPNKQLLWHNENSFNHTWPTRIIFACATPAAQGGETPLVDSRQVFQRIPAPIRQQFIDKQVMYVRNYGDGLGLTWQEVFRTTDPAQVEAFCQENFIDFEWKEGNRLRTTSVRPAVVAHPQSGEMCWFNQAQHWHFSCLDPATQASLRAIFAEEDLPRNCYYGDGTPIADEVMAEILDHYRQLEVSFPWQKGDVLLVDNVLTAHGRNPFVGERKILVAMGEVSSYQHS